MKAVILAAGQATRLRPLTEFTQKCLLTVHDIPVLDYQIAVLKTCGITDIAIVTGHCAELVRTHVAGHSPAITVIHNADYLETNNAYSLTLARAFVEESADGFLVVNSDLIFTPQMLQALLDAPEQDAIVIDKNPDLANDMVKVDMEGNRIREMSKTLPRERVTAQALGPVKFSKAGGAQYLDFIEGERKNWLFYTLSDYAKDHEFYGVENQGYHWAEIDTPEDLEDAHLRIPEAFYQDLNVAS